MNCLLFITVCCWLISNSKETDSERLQQCRTEVIKFICEISPTAATQAARICVSL